MPACASPSVPQRADRSGRLVLHEPDGRAEHDRARDDAAVSCAGFEDLKHSKDSADFARPVKGRRREGVFSDFLNLFLFSEKYDLGLMIKALQSRGCSEPRGTEPVAESGKEASFPRRRVSGSRFRAAPQTVVSRHVQGVRIRLNSRRPWSRVTVCT